MPVYSHSRLGSFEKCPLQYRYRYVDRIKRDVFGIEAFMGNRVHEALEHLYKAKGEGRTPKVGELLDVYRSRWEAEYSPEKVRIVRKEFCAADYQATGDRCLRDYYKTYHPFEDGETLGLELKFQFALEPTGRHQIMGFIDRVLRRKAGVYEVHDYKTSATLPSEEDLRRDRQLSIYQMAIQDKYPDAREVRLVWHYLAKRKRIEAKRSEQEIAAHRQASLRVIQAIESARDYPARESALCRWCEYRDICPTQTAQVAAEKAIEARALQASSEKRLMALEPRAGAAEQMSLLPPTAGQARPPRPRA